MATYEVKLRFRIVSPMDDATDEIHGAALDGVQAIVTAAGMAGVAVERVAGEPVASVKWVDAGPLRPVASGVGVESIAYGADGAVSFVGADGSERVVEPAHGRKP